MELKSTFPQRILFRLRIHSQTDSVTSTLIQRTNMPKTTATIVSNTAAADDGDAATGPVLLLPCSTSKISPAAV